ncbi:MAG TPA: sigma factor-like helix-turn-helix DNA-binding protein, partial [Longimicrobiales bacterium]|nr:sigma factor-like helix-turn-helix DNA-binding protein [Longimicrobiales bacterium]
GSRRGAIHWREAAWGEQRPDILWLEPYPDALLSGSDPAGTTELRESVRLAFIRALQVLPSRQRAVLILRDVLDGSAAAVASALDTSAAAANSALQRARETVRRYGGGPAEVAGGPALDARKKALSGRYVAAWEAGDLDEIAAMLTEEATHAMPLWPAWFVGREALRTVYGTYPVWNGRPGPGVFRILPTSLNGPLAWAEYCRERPDGPYRALALTVATLDGKGDLIAGKVGFVEGDLFPAMGLPEALD